MQHLLLVGGAGDVAGNKLTDQESIIQDWARDLGYGTHRCGSHRRGRGIVPDRALFDAWKQFQVENPDAPARLEPSRLDLPEGPFLGGDLMNLAIGQGELTATPLRWRSHTLRSSTVASFTNPML